MHNELQQFKASYITECLELLAEMEEHLLQLSEESADSEKLNAIFRCAHSIKGGAGAFGLTQIAQFTHILEALLDKLREGKLQPSRTIIDLLLKSRDIVLKMVTAARDNEPLAPDYGSEMAAELARICDMPPPVSATANSAHKASGQECTYTIQFTPHREMIAHGSDPLLLLRELKRFGTCSITVDTSRVPMLEQLDAEQCYLSWNIRIATAKSVEDIKEVFEFVEDECDLVITQEMKQADTVEITQKPKEESATAAPTAMAAATSIRVDIDKVDRLINMVGEIVIIQAMLAMQTRFLSEQAHTDLVSGINELTTHTRELQEAVMAVRMQPVKSIFSRMPRLVRDLSTQLGKDIRLTMSGEQTEVDKTIIEQLSDPLTHMIRNSIDHGVETPDIRTQAGKPAQGQIVLSASHRSGRIVIEVSDDGKGIDRDRVLKKAREKGIVSPDAVLSDSEIDQLIFGAGFSTAEKVTNVSGRGVGMDVVRRNIESIGGTVSLVNTPGNGTQFSISLPLTLAILDGMIVRIANECYIIPIANIIETMRPKQDDVRELANGNAVLNVRGAFVPVLFLCRVFGIRNAQENPSKGLVVLVENGHEQIGLVVDELIGQQQVVIKTLEENADPVPGISGATILGDGKVSLILDIAALRRMRTQADDDTPKPQLAA